MSRNRSASLVALCCIHHLSLKTAVIGAQHPSRRIWHSNRLVQTACRTQHSGIKCPATSASPHLSRLTNSDEVWEYIMQQSIILLLSVAIRGLRPPLVVLAEAEFIQQARHIQTHREGITMAKGEVIKCYKELFYIFNALVSLCIYA